MSTTIEKLNKIKTLLGVEVKFENLKLENGTELEAQKFASGESVFILTEDEKVPLPEGSYELEDNRILVVQEEGVILSIEEAKLDEHEEKEEEPKEEKEEKEEMAYVTKEELAKEMGKLKEELGQMISELMNDKKEMEEDLSQEEEQEELKAELSKPAAQAIKHAPVDNSPKELFSAAKGPQYATSTLERVINRINNTK